MKTNQYGFTPQKDTTDAVMEVKDFIMEGLAAEVIVLVSLDVKGAFDAAWWPSILNELRACGCPRNLYNLTKSYFSQRTVILSTNSFRLRREISKGCLQGSCCSLGFWNIQYNSLLNLNFKAQTKAVAFADDLMLPIRGESASVAENYSNGELSKITAWSKGNEIRFNEEKSRVMLVSRRKCKECKAIKVYLNKNPLEQVTRMKYLGIIIDHKFRFKEHITCAVERCTKLIHNISKSAKKSWGIKREAIKTIQRSRPNSSVIRNSCLDRRYEI